MAEKSKDAEDLLLGSMFDSQPVADDGFSVSVVRKIRRRLWLRRLAVPLAAVIGGAIAFKPLTGLVAALSQLWVLIPETAISAAAGSIPQLHIVVLGAVLLVAGLVGMRILED
jgi:hypothetical protein